MVTAPEEPVSGGQTTADALATGEVYRHILERMEEGVTITDPEGRFLFVSPRAAELLGYLPAELLGEHYSALIDPQERELVDGETLKRSQGISSQYETRVRRRDGQLIPIWVAATPLFAGDHFYGVLVVFRDISQEDQLRARFQALQQVAAAVGGTPHDLHNIFVQSRSALQVLVKGAVDVLFMVVDDTGETLRLLSVDPKGADRQGQRWIADHPLSPPQVPLIDLAADWREAIARGVPWVSRNIAGFLRHLGEGQVGEVGAVWGIAGFPLRSGGGLRGIVLVTLSQEHARQEDLELGMAVANLIARAMESLVLLKQARRQMYSLDRLFELTQAMTTSSELEELAAIAVRQFILALNVREASISLLDQEREALRLVIDLFYDEESELFQPAPGPEFYLLQDFPATREVLESRQPVQVLISDPYGDPNEQAYMREFGVKTLVILPLIHKGECMGVVELEDSLKEQRLTFEQMNLAMTLAGQVAASLENARLFTEVQQRAVQLQTAAEVARHATGILDVETLLTQMVELIRRRFALYYAGIFLVDETGQWAVLRAGTGSAGRQMLAVGHRLQVGGSSMIGWCTAHGEARIVLDVGKEAVRFENPHLPQTRSEMALPLISRGRVVGAMTIQSARPAAFSAEDITVLQTMADQLANAIENARLYVETSRRAEELAALNAVAVRLGQSLDLQEILDVATEEVTHIFGVEASAISLVSKEQAELVLCAQRGLHYSHLGMHIPLGKGMSGEVVRSGQVLVAGDVAQDPRLAVSGFAREQIQAMALVPMHSRGRVVGVLSAMSHSPRDFPAKELGLGQAIANQVAAAVENAQLFQAVKEHVADLEKAYARLQELDQMKDEMIQNVSHEMRTPLTFVKGYVELMMDGHLGPLTETQQQSIDIVYRKTEQLTRLVGDIITLQTVTPETLKLEVVDLGPLAQVAVDGCRLVAANSGVLLELDVAAGLSPALVDPSRIAQVFDNLLANAIKFSPDGGVIAIQVREEDKWLQVTISDTGIGIPKDKQGRIFDRFYQVDGSAQRRFGGAGLGLAIVKLIVEAHGGQVWVQSDLGRGSTFYLTLPKAAAAGSA